MTEGRPKPKVRVTLAATLRHLGQLREEPEVFQVDAASPLECLQIMVERYPSVRPWLYDKEGQLLPLAWFFVNDPEWKCRLPPEDLTRPLADGDEVIIAFGKV